MFRKFLKHIFYWSNRTANFCLSFFGIAITFQVERIDSKNKLPDYLHHLKPIDLEFGTRVGVVNLAIPYLAREDSIFAGTRMILALGATLLKSNIKLRFVITDEIWDHNSEKIAKNNFLKYFPDCGFTNFPSMYKSYFSLICTILVLSGAGA